MSLYLDEYLRFEQQMLRLDALPGGEAEADELRDFMDVLWRRVTESERQQLNGRAVIAPVARPRLVIQVEPGFVTEQRPIEARERAHARRVTVTDAEIWCEA